MPHRTRSALHRPILLAAETVLALLGVGGCLQPLPDKSGMRDTDASGSESDGEPAPRGPQSDTTTSTSGEMPQSDGGDRPDVGGSGGVSAAGGSEGPGSGGDDASGAPDSGAEGSDGSQVWCGDNVAQGEEACDGSDHAGNTCQTLGLGGGVLSCLADCSGFDTSQCGQAGGDCCFTLAHAGCSVASIESCVCDLDTYCCATAWDGTCADAAVSFCDAWCS